MAKRKKSTWKWILGILLLLLILGIAGAYFKNKNKDKSVKVEIAEVQKRTIYETVAASGKIYPEKEVKISSDVSGEIVKLYVKEGDKVEVGQLLANIDRETLTSAVDRGNAALNASKSQLAMARAQVESSRAQKQQILVQLENAKVNHKRNEKLFNDGVIARAEFDQTLATVNQLEANLRAAESSINSSMQNVKANEYSIQSSKASLSELKTNLSRASIVSPASGIITKLPVEEGEKVVGTNQMSGTEMMRISNLNAMEVQVDVSENDIVKVAVGDKVKIDVDAYINNEFFGTVTEIANSATTATTSQVTNFVVKVRIDPNSYKGVVQEGKSPFRPGMSASVEIETNKEETIAIPIQSVTMRDDTTKNTKKLNEVVFLVRQDSVLMKKVETGIQDSEYIVVKSGLNDGDKVVSGPYSAISKKLKEGTKISTKKDKENEPKKDK